MAMVLAVTLVALVFAVRDAVFGKGVDNSVDVLSLTETAISDLVYAAIAVFFLWSFPERLQRSRLLNLLHQLRSTAHVIDMHQLTKDPEQLKPSWVPTSKSTKLNMNRDQVERYLDYCSEMLSLVGKTAALCAEESRDSLILETVATVETLTVGLSRKIWQKISNLPPGDTVRRPGVLADEPASPGLASGLISRSRRGPRASAPTRPSPGRSPRSGRRPPRPARPVHRQPSPRRRSRPTG